MMFGEYRATSVIHGVNKWCTRVLFTMVLRIMHWTHDWQP